MGPDPFTMWLAEKIAERFHNAYEAFAPQFGYETREASRVAWEDVPEQNKGLMIRTVADLLQQGVIHPPMREGYFILNGSPGPGAKQLLEDAIREWNTDPETQTIDVAQELAMMRAVAHPGDFVEFEVIDERGETIAQRVPASFASDEPRPTLFRMGPVYVPHIPDDWHPPVEVEPLDDHDMARHGPVPPDDPDAPHPFYDGREGEDIDAAQSMEGVPSEDEVEESARRARENAAHLDELHDQQNASVGRDDAMIKATAVWPQEEK